MTKHKVIYKLEKTISYPKQMKQLLRIRAQAEQEGNTKSFMESSKKLIDLFYETEDYAKVLDHSRELLKYINNLKFSKDNILVEIFCLLKMADSCRTLNEFTKAIAFANKGLQVSQKWKLPLDMLDFLFEMGLSYMLRGESDDARVTDFSDASETFIRAESMLESVNLDVVTKDHLRIDIQTNLAIIKKDQGDPDDGIKVLEKALSSSTAKQNEEIQANLLCNLAYCHDEKRNYKVALKIGREELKIRKVMGDVEGEKQSLLDNATRYEKLRMFLESLKLLESLEKLCLERKDYNDDLKKDVHDRKTRISLKIKKEENLSELQRQLQLAIQSKDERHQMLLYEQIGEIQLELGLATQAKISFSAQKNLAMHFKVPSSLMIPICLNLCRACMEEGSCSNAEQYIRHALSLLGPNEVDQQISLRQKLVDAIKGGSQLTRKNHLSMLYHEIIDLSEQHKRYTEMEWCLYGLIDLHSFYNMTDNIRIDQARLERVQKILGRKDKDDESDDDEENYKNIEPMELVEKKIDIIPDIDQISCQKPPLNSCSRPLTTQSQVIIDDLSKQKDTLEANADVFLSPPQPVIVSKKKRKLITLDDIEFSQPEIIQPESIQPESIPPFTHNEKKKEKSNDNVKHTSSRTLRVILSSSQYSSQKQNNSAPLETFEIDKEGDGLPEAIPIDDLFFEDEYPEQEIIREVPPTPHPLSTTNKFLTGAETSSPLFPNQEPNLVRKSLTPVLSHSQKGNEDLRMMEDSATPIKRKSFGLSSARGKSLSRTECASVSTDTTSCPPTPVLSRPHDGSVSNEVDKTSVQDNLMPMMQMIKEGKMETVNQRIQSKHIPKVQVEYFTPAKKRKKILTIPYPDGPFGTPKTVSWLLNETNLRLKERYGKSAPIIPRILRNREQLCLRDNLSCLIDENEIVQTFEM